MVLWFRCYDDCGVGSGDNNHCDCDTDYNDDCGDGSCNDDDESSCAGNHG